MGKKVTSQFSNGSLTMKEEPLSSILTTSRSPSLLRTTSPVTVFRYGSSLSQKLSSSSVSKQHKTATSLLNWQHCTKNVSYTVILHTFTAMSNTHACITLAATSHRHATLSLRPTSLCVNFLKLIDLSPECSFRNSASQPVFPEQ